jgi:hypothetical protein
VKVVEANTWIGHRAFVIFVSIMAIATLVATLYGNTRQELIVDWISAPASSAYTASQLVDRARRQELFDHVAQNADVRSL